MHLVAIDARGGHQAVSTTPGVTYAWRSDGMSGPSWRLAGSLPWGDGDPLGSWSDLLPSSKAI